MKEFRIDMLSPVQKAVVLPRAPDGVRVSGLRSDPAAGPIVDSLFILVEVAKPIACGILARFIYERVAQYDAKRTRINEKEVSNPDEFERVVAEELEIGKND